MGSMRVRRENSRPRVLNVVTGSTASVNASYQVSDCEVSSQAVYQKLKGSELLIMRKIDHENSPNKLLIIRRKPQKQVKSPDFA